ncbi:putative aminotransferase ACS12 [Salvia divinorum]|uniref:Aminotransferase ACS12 n=1 Tax=Salvia divinorum TaxID=28513 RepID=A0ABD1HRS6_SALDI
MNTLLVPSILPQEEPLARSALCPGESRRHAGRIALLHGLDRVREDAYDELTNPDGVMQLGLSENRLSLDLIEERLSKSLTDLMSGAGGPQGIRG